MKRTISAYVTAVLVALLVGFSTMVSVAPEAVAAGAPAVLVGGFESAAEGWVGLASPEDPSATGSLALTAEAAYSATQSAKLSLNVSGPAGYGWFQAYRDLSNIDFSSLSFWIKAPGLSATTVQLIDGGGQTHQFKKPLALSTTWQRVTVALSEVAGDEHWGGANDGVWHGPMKRIGIIVPESAIRPSADGTQPASVTAFIDDVSIVQPIRPVTLLQSSLGNNFVGDAQVKFPVETSGDSLLWSVRNAAGTLVDSGKSTIPLKGTKSLTISDLAFGWYSLHVEAFTGSKSLGADDTTFSRLAQPQSAGVASAGAFGVGTHYGAAWNADSMPLVRAGGAGSLRDEMYWSRIERTPGVYDFVEAHTILDPAIAAGTKPLLIADYGNPLYDNGNGPTSPAAIEAYGNYAAALAKEFGGKLAGIEVWNEWDLGLGGNTNTSAAAYVNLLKVAAPKIKAASPGTTVIGSAVALLSTSFLEDSFKLGSLNYLDAVSLHPYSWPTSADALDASLTRVEALVKTYNDGKSKPLWITEHGWPTGTEARAVSQGAQAQNVAKSMLIAMAHSVPKYYVYDMVNDGNAASDPEQNFGMLHSATDPLGAYTPKPAYAAYSAASSILTGASFTDQNSSLPGVWNLGFTARDGSRVRGLWSATSQVVKVATTAPLTVTSLYGASTTYQPTASGTVQVQIGSDPVYITGASGAVASSAAQLSIDAAYVGAPLRLHWTADNTANPLGQQFQLAFPNGSVTQTVAAGKIGTLDFTLPAPTSTGPLTVTGQLSTTGVKGQALGQLSATVVVKSALALSGGHTLSDSGQQTLRLRLTNASMAPYSVEGVTYTFAGVTKTVLVSTTVAGAGELTYDVPLDGVVSGSWTASAKITGETALTASGKITPLAANAVNNAARHTVVVDGVLDDGLSTVPSIDLNTDATYQSFTGGTRPAGLGGKVYYTWDQNNLYLTAVVTDPTHSQSFAGSDIWQGDSIQFTVGSGGPGEQASWNEVGIALTPAGPQMYRWMSATDPPNSVVPGSAVQIRRDNAAGTTTYEASVPWNQLGVLNPSDGLFSSSFVVNVNDGNGRIGYLAWGGGIAGAKDSTQFKAMHPLSQ